MDAFRLILGLFLIGISSIPFIPKLQNHPVCLFRHNSYIKITGAVGIISGIIFLIMGLFNIIY